MVVGDGAQVATGLDSGRGEVGEGREGHLGRREEKRNRWRRAGPRSLKGPRRSPPEHVATGGGQERSGRRRRAHLVESSKSSREREDEEDPSVWESDESARLPAPLFEVMLPFACRWPKSPN